jgi:elongation factor G
MSRYLEQGESRAGRAPRSIEKALRDGHLVPVCFVSARTAPASRSCSTC